MVALRPVAIMALVLLCAACPPPPDSDGNVNEGEGEGEGQGEGEGEGDPLVTEDVCAHTARIVCAALETCGCDPALRGYDDLEDCVSERSTDCAASLPPELVARLDAGTVRWVPELVDACTADLEALAAGCVLVPTASCGTLFADPAPLGELCAPGNEGGPCAQVTGRCGDELRCTPLPDVGEDCAGNCRAGLLCVGGVCAVPGEQGAACTDPTNCVPALTCRDGACAPRADVGDSCTSTQECAAGLACVDGACATLPSRTEACRNETECGALDACVRDLDARVCAAGGTVGDRCSFEQPCTPDLRCINDACTELPTLGEDCAALFECADGTTCDGAVCVARPGLDEPCLEFYPRCADGLGCNPTNNRCGAGGEDGEPCHMTGNGDLCAEDLGCDFTPDGSICRPRSATGGPCTNDTVCDAGDYCDFGTLECAPRRAEDAPCSAGNECAAGLLCAFGPGGVACRPPPGPGEPCSYECSGDAVCAGVGGVCQPQLCSVP